MAHRGDVGKRYKKKPVFDFRVIQAFRVKLRQQQSIESKLRLFCKSSLAIIAEVEANALNLENLTNNSIRDLYTENGFSRDLDPDLLHLYTEAISCTIRAWNSSKNNATNAALVNIILQGAIGINRVIALFNTAHATSIPFINVDRYKAAFQTHINRHHACTEDTGDVNSSGGDNTSRRVKLDTTAIDTFISQLNQYEESDTKRVLNLWCDSIAGIIREIESNALTLENSSGLLATYEDSEYSRNVQRRLDNNPNAKLWIGAISCIIKAWNSSPNNGINSALVQIIMQGPSGINTFIKVFNTMHGKNIPYITVESYNNAVQEQLKKYHSCSNGGVNAGSKNRRYTKDSTTRKQNSATKATGHRVAAHTATAHRARAHRAAAGHTTVRHSTGLGKIFSICICVMCFILIIRTRGGDIVKHA